MKIKYFNREKKKIEIEKVYVKAGVSWLYGSKSGKIFSPIICSTTISKLYGVIQSSSLLSHKRIASFIKNYNINIDEFEIDKSLVNQGLKSGFKNFNQFFVRKFKKNKRPFISKPKIFPAFAEARYFAYKSLSNKTKVPVKGQMLTPLGLLQSEKWSKVFNKGPALIARLCPVDYHRFHFPDNGKLLESYRLKGKLHSVNPLALKKKKDILISNERHVNILETENFGTLAFIEVGATMVGKIVQSHLGKFFKRGNEKGYFLFGGSSIIVLGQKGKWTPDKDLLEHTNKRTEVFVKLGQSLAQATKEDK